MNQPPTQLIIEPGEGPRPLREIGRGGEGCVLEILGCDTVLLKWYQRELTDERRRRLAAALAVGADPARAARHPGVCWPLSVVLDTAGRDAGCLIDRAPAGSVDLSWLASERMRSAKGLSHDRRIRVAVVRAVARIVAGLHADGWVIGDLRRANVMIRLTGPSPAVRLIDSDSLWRASHACRTRIATSEASDGCAAPEVLRGEVVASQLADRWALATLIFMTLREGAHPLAVAGAQHATYDAAVLSGAPPPALFSRLPVAFAELCEKTFIDGYDAPAERPCAAAWDARLAGLH